MPLGAAHVLVRPSAPPRDVSGRRLTLAPLWFRRNRCMQSFWRAQRIVKPYTWIAWIGLAIHLPVCWLFVELWGFHGACWAMPINQWAQFFLLIGYNKWKGKK